MADSPPPRRKWRIAHSEASLGWGGQEHRIMAEINGFRRRGSEVWLIAPGDSQIYQRASQAGVPVLAQRFNQRHLTLVDAGRFDGCPPSWDETPGQMASTGSNAGSN